MRARLALAAAVLAAVPVSFPFSAAQPPQVPTVQASNKTLAKGKAQVLIASRHDVAHAGRFTLHMELTFDPATADYPTFVGTAEIQVDLSDSAKGTVVLGDVEQATTTGKHSPTVYLNGRCKVDVAGGRPITGCRYWLMVADNKPVGQQGTADVIGFLVVDKAGKRVAYGTGPVAEGDFEVADTPN